VRSLDFVKQFIAILLCLWSTASLAQNARSLTQISVSEASAGEVLVTLDFDQAAPEARIGGNDTNRITVTLLSTSRGPAARYESDPSSLLRDIVFTQESTSLLLTFVLAAKTNMEMTVDSQRRFVVKLTALERPTGSAANDGRNGDSVSGPGEARSLRQAVDPPPGEDSFELIQLKYADVSEVVGLLSDGETVRSNDSFIPREPGFGSPGTNTTAVQTLQDQNQPDDRPLGEAVDSRLAIDRRLNAIWVRGSPAQIARVRAQIEMIDIPLTSVLLETEFVELTETGAKSIGLDFANANGQIAVATVQSGQFIPFANLTNSSVPKRLDSLSLQAALYAQIAKGEGRIISKPRIAAQSGSTAKIITGDALPILTAITLSGVNGVSQQVQYVNVGVTLQIAPRVSSDGYVTSHVFCVVSSVTGFSQGYPTISQREAETSATVRDGEAFVIGGLVQESELKSRAKIPLLGDIPILGRAFNVDRRTSAKTELYILITPHIIHRDRGQPTESNSPSN
jgi:general secretion pathway protein D